MASQIAIDVLCGPFNIIRWAFFLVALVVSVVMLETLLGVLACIWATAITGREPPGSCQEMTTQIREVVSELVTALLALIIAGSNRTPPPQE